jgi:hypothetical protein
MEGVNENRISISATIREDILQKADKIVRDGLIVGINNRSALLEYGLNKVFKEVFKEVKA